MGIQVHEDRYGVVQKSLTPTGTAATTSAEQTFTVTGLTTSMFVSVNPPASQTAGIGIVGARVSAANTLAIMFMNSTDSGATSVAGTYTIFWFRPEITGLSTVQR